VKNHITVYADRGSEKISRHIYGHFAEHLGRCIYGGFYVGENNSVVAHTEGFRWDIIEALKKLNIPNLRWPGGCFADTYHWKDGIGPKNKRPSIVNKWWGNIVEDNSFGTHEFLRLCELLKAEPYLAANVGSGAVQEVADWVQYVNFDGLSPMSELRKMNGRDQSWQVKFWGIGNEAWGCGGNMSAQYYANVYRQYVTFMTGWSNSEKLFRIASGANSADYNWTEVLMLEIPPGLVEGLALHHYAVNDWNNKGAATGFSKSEYMLTIQAALRMDELVARHAAIMDTYDPGRKIALVVDEWGTWYDVEPGTHPGFLYQQNTMRDAVVAGITLNIFNKHCARVRMANLAQTVNVLQSVIFTSGEKMWVTPTYHVMEMYKVHQDGILLPSEVTSPTAANFKSPISFSASMDEQKRVHLSIVNIDVEDETYVTINVKGMRIEKMKGRILHSGNVNDHNTESNPTTVKLKPFHDFKLKDENIELTLPPASVCVMELS
jgi:alpha-L-arabinofuranosidase